MLTIRLQRTGTKNKPSFRVVLAESYRAAGKKALEVLGHYNPIRKDFGIKDPERLKYWIGQHVSISPTVHNLLVEKKMLDGKKVKAWQPKKKEGEAQATATPAPQTVAPTAESVPAETPAEQPQA
jgi:small subunit ribosomal protein S16